MRKSTLTVQPDSTSEAADLVGFATMASDAVTHNYSLDVHRSTLSSVTQPGIDSRVLSPPKTEVSPLNESEPI